MPCAVAVVNTTNSSHGLHSELRPVIRALQSETLCNLLSIFTLTETSTGHPILRPRFHRWATAADGCGTTSPTVHGPGTLPRVLVHQPKRYRPLNSLSPTAKRWWNIDFSWKKPRIIGEFKYGRFSLENHNWLITPDISSNKMAVSWSRNKMAAKTA